MHRLHVGVVVALAAAHEGALHVGPDHLAVGVEVDPPHHGRAQRPGQQAGRVLRQHRRVQRHLARRQVDGLAPLAGLGVDHAAGAHERADVGDGVPDAVSGAEPFQVDGLVEVHRAGRVDGDERDVGHVLRVQLRHLGHPGGLVEHGAGEAAGQLQFSPDPLETVLQLEGYLIGNLNHRHTGQLTGAHDRECQISRKVTTRRWKPAGRDVP